MQTDLLLYPDSVTRAVFPVLYEVLKVWRISTALFPKLWSLKQDFPKMPYTESIPLLWKPICYLPPLRESSCKLVYQTSLRIPALKKKKLFFSLFFKKSVFEN